MKGCPLVGRTLVCRPNFKPKINRTYTSTKNTTATLSIPYDVTLKARIKKLTASSFEFLTNRSDVIINLEMSTYGRASWVFYRVQSTSPQTPPYPQSPLDIIHATRPEGNPTYPRSKDSKLRLDTGTFICKTVGSHQGNFPGSGAGSMIDTNKFIQNRIQVYKATNCSIRIRFQGLIAGETYAFFAVANRTQIDANFKAKIKQTTPTSMSFVMQDARRPS